jgi:hypothetical protein
MKGTVFIPFSEDTHPYIIISDELDGYVLVVNLSDARKHPDSTCFIKRGEHPAVTKDSAVFYKAAKPREVALLKKNLQKYATVFAEPCSPAILERIIAGALHEHSTLFRKWRVYLE